MAQPQTMHKKDKVCTVGKSDSETNNIDSDNNVVEISCNWSVTDNCKELKNVVSIGFITDVSARMSLEDIVDEARCIEIKPKSSDNEACNVEIKIKNRQKIKRIGVVSEASILEIFRENGEYAFTIFAELIDEFQDSTVHYANINFNPPTSETTIKFTRIKNNRSTMFLYGIKLILGELQNIHSLEQVDFNPIVDLLANSLKERNKRERKIYPTNDQRQTGQTTSSNYQNSGNLATTYNSVNVKLIKNASSENMEEQYVRAKYLHDNCDSNILAFIDSKLKEMEKRIFQRICLMEANTEKKLNEIQNLLELYNHEKNIE